MLWKREVNLSLRWLGRMHIDVTIEEVDGYKWRLTGIYGEPRPDHREETWRLLRTLHQQEKLPWVCIRDFNEILYNFEKQGGVPRAHSQMDRFHDALNFCNLNDLGFEGDVFTWRNNNFRLDGYIRERLDRAVANPQWCMRFPGYKVRNGCPEHSDHRPVILDVHGAAQRRRPPPNNLNKRFEARWLLEEDCEQLVTEAWEDATRKGNGRVMERLKCVSRSLDKWSREVLGDLQKRIKKLRAELEESRTGDLSEAAVRKEQVLRFKLGRLEEQLDVFWKQRAHVGWLTKGDRNTEYFHGFASTRKRANRITKLRGDDGVEVEEEEGLKALVSNHFFGLFTPMAGTNIEEVLQHVQLRVTPEMNTFLRNEYTVQEIKNALDDMGDLKAPGADGMPAVFYKRFWGTVGEVVVQEVLHVLQGGSIPEG